MTIRHLVVLSLIGLNSLPVLADTEEIYRFERMWPVLQQPWYFEDIWDLAISQQGHVYLADRANNRVQKLTLEGHLITEFGAFDGSFRPIEIAVDSEENIYVAYTGVLFLDHIAYVVRKFNAHGELISDKWKEYAQCSDNIGHIAVDQQDNVYLTCASKKGQAFVHKLTSDGQWLEKWPIHSDGDLAIDQNHVYILDRSNNRVHKYTLSGESVMDWTTVETDSGDLVYKTQDIAIDRHGHIYVTDSFNRIQKFSSEGDRITEWRDEINLGGTFQIIEQSSPKAWQVLKLIFSTSNIEDLFSTPIPKNMVEEFCFSYRADNSCSNVWQIFEALFEYESSFPTTIAVGPQDPVFVAYGMMSPSVKKYTPEGQLMNQWASGSNLNVNMLAQYLMPLIDSQWASSINKANKPFEFHQPFDIAQDNSGNLYVTDEKAHRILKFTTQGELITQWGESGEGEGQFLAPKGIAIDSKDNIYIVDSSNCRIQKLTADGQFLKQWGGQCVGGNDSLSPSNIAVDNNDDVYVIDIATVQIKKFTSEGDLIIAFGDKHLSRPWAITVDNNDNVYVTDISEQKINKFTNAGQFVEQWDSHVSQLLTGIDTDEAGDVYVSDIRTHRIQKLTPNGQLMNQWGSFGSDQGQFNGPGNLTVSPDGDRVYVVESRTNRIQVFNRSLYDVGKAIIVAGGRDEDDSLWDATQVVANFAYRALTYQGFTKNTIYYLNANTGLDLDNNGEPDDVDAEPTKENLKYAITEWAKDTDNLTIYLTDHGGDKIFQINGGQTLEAAELNEWLNSLQADKTGRIKIIYDACQSGSFLPHFVPPEDKNRLVITSAEAAQNAYFDAEGSLSFSGHFWSHIFYGLDLENTFKQTTAAVDYLQSVQTQQKQTPQLEANGNGIPNEAADYLNARNVFIGNGTFIPGEAPVIESVSKSQTLSATHTATITAQVNDDNGIARVWAVVRSPADLERTVTGETVTKLPSFELQLVEDNRYQGHYEEFSRTGAYELAIYATDQDGNTSVPKITTVFVENTNKRRAIIVAGDLPSVLQNTGQAYEALRHQGYQDDDIYYLSNTSRQGVDVLATLDNLKFAVQTWANENTLELVIYLEGWGNATTFQISQTDPLSFKQLDTWLDSLQQSLTGAVTVIYDGPVSGHLIPALTPQPNQTRIVITSTGKPENACSNPDSLERNFSPLFWEAVLNGTKHIRSAFTDAKKNIRSLINEHHPYWTDEQTKERLPQLDDNGNGISNEHQDGYIAKQHQIGIGILTAADTPLIGTVSYNTSPNTVTLRAEEIATMGTLEKVWAVITPPCHSPESAALITLEPTAEGHYVGHYELNSEGRYQLALYAQDTRGRRSRPNQQLVIHHSWPLKPSQPVYRNDEQIQVTFPVPQPEGYQQYLAVSLPDGSLFVINGLNHLVPFDSNALPAWAGNSDKVADHLKVDNSFPRGEYRLYRVMLPTGTALEIPPEPHTLRESVFEVK